MKYLAGIGCTLFLGPCFLAADVPPIDQGQYAKLMAVIKPDRKTEAWQQIPWQSSLWDARKQAAREGKPILLWEMDGHPLGCV